MIFLSERPLCPSEGKGDKISLMYNSVILILCHENAHSITTLDIDRMV